MMERYLFGFAFGILFVVGIQIVFGYSTFAIDDTGYRFNGPVAGSYEFSTINFNEREGDLFIRLHNVFLERPVCGRDWSTWSMNQTFGCNNTLMETGDLSNLRVGDIVSFDAPDIEGRTHRIVAMDGKCIWTKGDNNLLNDSICVKKEWIDRKIIGVIWTR
jgi:hypothetical protein